MHPGMKECKKVSKLCMLFPYSVRLLHTKSSPDIFMTDYSSSVGAEGFVLVLEYLSRNIQYDPGCETFDSGNVHGNNEGCVTKCLKQ